MDIGFIELWFSLQRLPLPIGIAVYALVLLSTVCLFLIPLVLMIRVECDGIFKLLRQGRDQNTEKLFWRRVLRASSIWMTLTNTVLGRVTTWLVLYLTLMQFVIVVMRYVFAYGSVQMQESIWYMHGLLFMLGAGYTLAKDGHVRLDIFYRNAKDTTKAWINLVGSALFLIPFCVVNFDFAWPLVQNSWAVKEGSVETVGLPYLYLFKSVILVFSVVLAVEGISLALKSFLYLTDPSRKEVIGT